MKVNVSFGIGSSVTGFVVPPGTTVDQLIANLTLREVLGHGDNVKATIDGVVQGGHVQLSEGDDIELETRVGEKH